MRFLALGAVGVSLAFLAACSDDGSDGNAGVGAGAVPGTGAATGTGGAGTGAAVGVGGAGAMGTGAGTTGGVDAGGGVPAGGTGTGGAPTGAGLDLADSACPAPTLGSGSAPLVSTFEAGASAEVLSVDGRGGSWFSYPSGVELSVVSDGADGSTQALRVAAAAATGDSSGAGLILNSQGNLSCAHNATAYAGVAFWVKSPAVTSLTFSVAQGWTTPNADGGTCKNGCFNHYQASIPVSTGWQRVELTWDQLKAAGFGQAVPFDPRQLTQLIWQLPADAAFEVLIDDVEFLPGGTADTSVPPGYVGSGTGGAGSGGPGCEATSTVIDDVEGAGASSRWYTVAGNAVGTTSLTSEVVVDSSEGGKAARAKGAGYDTVSLVRELSDAGVCFSTDAGGVTFRADTASATTIEVRLALASNTPAEFGGTCTSDCYDYHRFEVPLTPGWKEYAVDFSQMYQEGFGAAVDPTLADALRLEFVIPGASFEVSVDDLATTPATNTGPAGAACACGGPNVPFGSKPATYTSGVLTPSGATDSVVTSAYNTWKAKYLKSGCGGNYVQVDDAGANVATVSEAMGYGMLLTALMAGHDPNAKALFDGLWSVARNNSSSTVSEFMTWKLSPACVDADGNQSATDGDMDIAYALLLADRQWGSCGSTDYRQAAFDIQKRLMERTVDSQQKLLWLGDWVTASNSFASTTRSSDFMPDHLRAFQAVSNDARWTTLRSNLYSTFASVQDPTTGIITDFILNADTNPVVPAGQVLEKPSDATYSLNASRVPFRLGVDYLMHGDAGAKSFLDKLVAFAAGRGTPGQFAGNYFPDGDSLDSVTAGGVYYIGPLGVGAMVAGNQSYLNAAWNYAANKTDGGVYYKDTLALLSMVAMSGNWWSPAVVSCQ